MLCLTCGKRSCDPSQGECYQCRYEWKQAQKNPKHLPTVELFPLAEVVKPIPPKVGETLDLGL